MIFCQIAVEDYIANLSLSLISEDGDLVRLIELVILERQIVKALTIFSLADGQPMHDFHVFLVGRVAHPNAGHDVPKVFVIVSYDSLDTHARFVVRKQLGQVGHQISTLLLYAIKIRDIEASTVELRIHKLVQEHAASD